MKYIFSRKAQDDYDYFKRYSRKDCERCKKLLEDISRNAFNGLGKPEPLRGDLSGYWSRRVNEKDRLIYSVSNDVTYILAFRTHYSK